ncbi:MAG: T9SS type A sorting domain-containing protein [Bacteroidales bacterium]|nr:T9SS type A sorting domain-containing protein [Bacteroidales bacterium]
MKLNFVRKTSVLFLLLHFVLFETSAQDITIKIDATQDKKVISANIYGRNNTFDKASQFYKDAGLRFVRMCGGNNATKYNWRKKITSHPDWYNNVYSIDWDEISQKIALNHPEMQVMWSFQLLGRVASSTKHNFNDWEYNNSKWWGGVGQNLAGGGVPNEDDPWGKALFEGNIYLYTMEWPADSTVAILDHWFGDGGLGLNKNQFLYWSMDNEADIWNGTHDDVMKNDLLPASEFMDNYIEVAKKARAKIPEIKICGPVTTSEWQWYKWGEENIYIDEKYYCWLEYFIKRCADEEKSSGVRVLDVVDLHNYPYAPKDADALQNHRMYYEKNYIYPGANGIKTINGGWENSQNKEYIFQRINDWLLEYFGEDHGIKLALSEWSPGPDEPNLASVIYASHLGTFANNNVEFFTPWSWFTGMWETLHLFSRYAKGYSVSSISSEENTVSAYTTVSETLDSTTVILVNRDMNNTRRVTVNLKGVAADNSSYNTLQLSSLPKYETFKSHTDNALVKASVNVSSNSFTIQLPALSTTAVLLRTTPDSGISANKLHQIELYPNPASSQLTLILNSDEKELLEIWVIDPTGRKVKTFDINYDGCSPVILDTSTIPEGYYIISVKTGQSLLTKRFAIIK